MRNIVRVKKSTDAFVTSDNRAGKDDKTIGRRGVMLRHEIVSNLLHNFAVHSHAADNGARLTLFLVTDYCVTYRAVSVCVCEPTRNLAENTTRAFAPRGASG